MDFHKHEEKIKLTREVKSKKNRESIKYFEKVGELMIKDFNNKPFIYRKERNNVFKIL